MLVWPMEQHEILDADRKKAIVVQFSSSFVMSLFDFQRIMHYFHDLHVIRKKDHPELVKKMTEIVDEMRAIFDSDGRNRAQRISQYESEK